MKSVNFAILGCGKIGSRHAEQIKNTEHVRLIAVCDIVERQAKELSKRYACKFYVRLEDLLNDSEVDVVNICTPSGLHAEHSILCLRNGKHVLCEKPMALRVKDAQAMVKTARAFKKMLYIVKQNRYNPPVKLVKRLFDQDKLGRPIMCVVNMIWNRNMDYYNSAPWRGTKALDGGTIFTQAIHFVDLMLMFLGQPKSVYALMGTKKLAIEIEDTGVIVSEFKNGAYGSFNYTTAATKNNAEGSIIFIFEKGTIRIGGEYINTIDYFQVEGMDNYELEPATTAGNNYGTYRGTMSNHAEIFKDLVAKFNNPYHHGNLVDGEEALQTINFIEHAQASVVSGKKIIF